MATVLLILPTATYRADDFLDAAERLSADVVIASERRQALADAMGDRFCEIDLAHPEDAATRIVELARHRPIDAIVPVDDQGVLVAAYAAETLGLPHNPPSAVGATRNKAMLRRALDGIVPQPPFELAVPDSDVTGLASLVGWPVVVKPLSLSGSRGVIRVDHPRDLPAAAERVRRILLAEGRNPNEPILLERYVGGDEIAIEGLLTGGELEVLAVFDKPDPLEGPYFEETIYVTPSRLHPEVLEEAIAVTARATEALGLREGPIHAELRIEDGQPYLIEVAARSIGGLCGRALHFGLLGSSLETVLLRHALGLGIRGLRRQDRASGVMMLPIPRAGVLEAVHGIDAAKHVPQVTDLTITIPLGGRVVPLPEGDRYLGFLFAEGDTPEQVTAALREGYDRLRFDIV